MSRISTLATSFGVGSIHVGLRDLSGTERRATFQFESADDFFAEILATNNFDFDLNVGSNWVNVTDRIFKDQGEDDPDFVDVGGRKQRRRKRKSDQIVVSGIYAMDDGFMPGAFQINVTSANAPIAIFFGV